MLRRIVLLFLVALAAAPAAGAAASNGPVGWTEYRGGAFRHWLSRGLTDFTPTLHSTRVGASGVYSPDGSRWATLLGAHQDRLTLLDDDGDNRGTLVTSPSPFNFDSVTDWSRDG